MAPIATRASSHAMIPRLNRGRRRRAMWLSQALPADHSFMAVRAALDGPVARMSAATGPILRRSAVTDLPAFFVRYQTLERKNGSWTAAALFLLQHELALLLDQRFRLVGDHPEQPRQLDLDADVIVGDVDGPAGGLPQDGDAQ